MTLDQVFEYIQVKCKNMLLNIDHTAAELERKGEDGRESMRNWIFPDNHLNVTA